MDLRIIFFAQKGVNQMPETKIQKTIFGVLMSFFMVYVMEVYNSALRSGGLVKAGFWIKPIELFLLAVVVFTIENINGGRIARKLALRLAEPGKDKEILVIIMVQVMTVCVMCPSMSLVASFAFKHAYKGHFFAIWLETIAMNFPMALAWQIFICGPIDRLILRKVVVPIEKKLIH